MRRWKRALFLTAVIAVAGCSSDSDSSDSSREEDRPGDPAVYSEIAAETNCVKMQAAFDRNMTDHDRRKSGDPLREVVLAYAEAYDDRMEEAGCY